MKNPDQPFCIDDVFYSDITSFILDNYFEEKEAIDELPDDWVQKIQYCNSEKVFVFKEGDIEDIAERLLDMYDDRRSESGDELDDITKALIAGIDFAKVNELMPELYYPNGEKDIITKQDLLESI